MRKLLTLIVALNLFALWAGSAQAQVNLLGNPDLDDDPSDVFPWELMESPAPNNIAELRDFAAHSGAQGLWLREFEGLFFGNGQELTSATLTQIVPGSPGNRYAFTGWSKWEQNYSGGVTTLSPSSPAGAIPSPTETLMELAFLDAGFKPIGAPIVLDLRTEQMNDEQWRQHTLMRLAPAGTANVQVTASALDMIPNVDPRQSAFFDDFMLFVSEPGTVRLEAGDANQDLAFSFDDILAVLAAGKFETGEAATWGEGDWDGAPGGSVSNPPPGDGIFNFNDILAALSTGLFETGPYGAAQAEAVPEPSTFTLAALGLLTLLTFTHRRRVANLTNGRV